MVVDLVQNGTTFAFSYSIYRGTDFRVQDDAKELLVRSCGEGGMKARAGRNLGPRLLPEQLASSAIVALDCSGSRGGFATIQITIDLYTLATA